jgi:hypothetical protein
MLITMPVPDLEDVVDEILEAQQAAAETDIYSPVLHILSYDLSAMPQNKMGGADDFRLCLSKIDKYVLLVA